MFLQARICHFRFLFRFNKVGMAKVLSIPSGEKALMLDARLRTGFLGDSYTVAFINTALNK